MKRLFLGAVLAFFVAGALAPPVTANGSVPPLFPSWGGWTDGSRPTYKFASSMPLQWMRNEASYGVNASGNTRYQNPVFRLVSSGSTNVTVGMRVSPSYCAGTWSGWYACTELITAFSTWNVWLSSGYCWMNGGQYRTCFDRLTFDVWSVVDHEFLHVNNLNHHSPNEPSNSVMLPVFPHYAQAYWQNRYPRSHDLAGLSRLYGRDPCLSPCLRSGGQ